VSRDARAVQILVQRDAADLSDLLTEKEPNNFPGNALELPLNKGVKGYIGKPYGPQKDPDRDFFKFTVPPGQPRNLWARVSGVSGLRIALEVREGRSYGTLKVVSAARVGGDATLTNLTLEPGNYYFRVRERWTGKTHHHNEKTPYVLRWSLSELAAGDEREPNDELYQASEFTVGQRGSGYLGNSGDRDYYKVFFGEIDEAARLRVEITGLSGVKLRLHLFDGTLKPLVQRGGRRGQSVVFRNLKLPRVKDHFYIKVVADDGKNDRHPYTLKVRRDAVGSGVEREPNDKLRLAMRLSGERGSVKGILESKQDRDTFRISVSRSTTLRLEAKPQKDLDLQIALLDRKGRPIAKANAGKAGFAEVFPNMRLRPGDTWVRVTARDRPPRAAKYLLRWKLLRIEKGDEVEPNDKPRQATTLVVGQSARGYIYPSGDVDIYRFRLRGRSATTGRVRLLVQGIPKVKLKLSLLDTVRNVLGEATKRSFAGVRVIEVNLHVGKWYYLRVEDADGRRANSVDSYELEVVRKW
jgi:hypothetical protein